MTTSPSSKVHNLGKIGEARLDLVPLLSQCNPGIQPTEYNVVVAPARMPDKIGSLFIPEDARDREEMALQVGRIVSMSPIAFNYDTWPSDAAKPQPGQLVWFAKYAGALFEGMDGESYRIIKDKDIGAVIETPRKD